MSRPFNPFRPKRLADQHRLAKRTGTPRKVPAPGQLVGRSGAFQDMNAACREATGLRFQQLAALVILAARHRAGWAHTTYFIGDEFMREEEGISIGHAFSELQRLRLAVDLGRLHGAAQWSITAEGLRRVELMLGAAAA